MHALCWLCYAVRWCARARGMNASHAGGVARTHTTGIVARFSVGQRVSRAHVPVGSARARFLHRFASLRHDTGFISGLGLCLCLWRYLGPSIGQRLVWAHRDDRRQKRRRLPVGPARAHLPGRFSDLGLDGPRFIGGLGEGVGLGIGLRICSRLGLGLGFRFAVDLRCPSELPSWPGAGGIDPCHHNRGLQERPETLQY